MWVCLEMCQFIILWHFYAYIRTYLQCTKCSEVLTCFKVLKFLKISCHCMRFCIKMCSFISNNTYFCHYFRLILIILFSTFLHFCDILYKYLFQNKQSLHWRRFCLEICSFISNVTKFCHFFGSSWDLCTYSVQNVHEFQFFVLLCSMQ